MRLYEINTRAHCSRFEEITAAELMALSRLGFDSIWLMGIWQPSDAAGKISRIISNDFVASPYASPEYAVSGVLGGSEGLRLLVERAHWAALSVIVDFVSNHMAVDSPWLDERPDFFIRSDPNARRQRPSDFFLHKSGEVFAFGRDPHFPPWVDTAQLDYTSEALRARMSQVFQSICGIADGVRCDMAMLVLRDYIREQWYPYSSEAAFGERTPGEFWDRALSDVVRRQPSFLSVAEAYWDKERRLLDLGFDLAYEKKLYDGLVNRDLPLILSRLSRSRRDLDGSLYFIENHDEERAAALFDRGEQLAAAALIMCLPGSVLIHEGQMEGKRERLPVQRLRPTTDEPLDDNLRAQYVTLLQLTRDQVFKTGAFYLFEPGAPGTLGLIRQNSSRTVVYVGQLAAASGLGSSVVDLTEVSCKISAARGFRTLNLVNSVSCDVIANNGTFNLRLSDLGVDRDARHCLLEIIADSL